MKMRKVVSLLLAFAMTLSLASVSASVPTQAAEAVKEDLVVVMPVDIDGFDPTFSSQLYDTFMLPYVYDGLYEKDLNTAPRPALAETTTQISDTEWEFKIYEGVMNSDGTELTAEDVVWSLQRAKEASIAKSVMAPVESIEQVDKYTIRITTSSLAPTLTTSLAHLACLIVPKHYGEEAIASGDWSHPVGSGRYTVEYWNLGDSFKMVKNENYFNPEQAARNKSITMKVVPEGTTRTIMVESGEADAAFAFQTSDYARVMEEDNVTLLTNPSTTMYFFEMDTQNEYFSNKLVRQAVNYAIDRESCLLVGYDGLGSPLYTYLAPPCLSYVEKPVDYTYDPEKAKELLAEAGYPDGFNTTLVTTNELGTRVAEVIQAYLLQVGINAEISQVESTTQYTAMATAGELPCAVCTWACWQDPDMFVGRLWGEAGMGGTNHSRFQNERFEELFQLGKSTFDEATRVGYYEEMQALLAEECPWCPILCPDAFALVNSELQDVTCGSAGLCYLHELHY